MKAVYYYTIRALGVLIIVRSVHKISKMAGKLPGKASDWAEANISDLDDFHEDNCHGD